MARESKIKAKKTPNSHVNLWGWTPESLLVKQLAHPSALEKGKTAQVTVHSSKKADQVQQILESETSFEVRLFPLVAEEHELDGRLKTPASVRVRDAVGALVGVLERHDVVVAEIDFQLDGELLAAALLGLEIALYRFKRVLKGESSKVRFQLKHKGRSLSPGAILDATHLGVAVNFARHLTNLPPNLLNPETYAQAIASRWAKSPHVQVEIWDEKRLKKEGMNLHLGVGQGSNTPPRLVHLSYRPKASKAKAPVALVGKGITFDSGGLDIKPSSGMRLMKKDMGGSAAVVALFEWAVETQIAQPLDVYLALAENAISGAAFRPSDVLVSRNGLSVEIHNTDAEGRLVLADALDVAIKAKATPSVVIDVATLTGAIKTALGAQIGGLFSNDSKLAQALNSAGQRTGDLTWVMPLFERYRSQLNSNFADLANATDGFGGAITAALFLEKFVGATPWAHLDIYAWKDSAEGAWLEAGGSGQAVLCLAEWLKGGNRKAGALQ